MSGAIMFKLDADQYQKLIEWEKTLEKRDAYTGAIGGRFTYSFTPTSLGTVTKVQDGVTGAELDLTDYDW